MPKTLRIKAMLRSHGTELSDNHSRSHFASSTFSFCRLAWATIFIFSVASIILALSPVIVAACNSCCRNEVVPLSEDGRKDCRNEVVSLLEDCRRRVSRSVRSACGREEPCM